MRFTEEEILRILYQHNPWWLKKPIPESRIKPIKRRDFFKLKERLDDNKILALIGPRQVGKTTLLYQLINEILTSSINQKNILFISLDDPYLNISINNLGNIFEIYSKNILKESLSDTKEKLFFFLDEIQTIKNWEYMVKRWYDLGYKIKFVITGSSSINITEGSSEALVGRIYPQIVFPLKFIEYLRFKQNDIAELLKTNNKKMREALKQSLSNKNSVFFYNAIAEQSKLLVPYRDNILIYLNQYLIKGGYPELVNTDDLIVASQYIGTYLYLTIYKDILRMKKIQDSKALENLFAILCKESSKLTTKVTLSNTLDLKKETLRKYIEALKTTFLISEAEYFSESRTKRVRKEKKIFINDIGIRNYSSSVFDEQILTNNTEMGKIVETVIADHTRRLRFNLEATPFPPIFYWREKKYEVDFVINPFNTPIPIEVKYKEDIKLSDLDGLREFNNKFDSPFSLVITKNILEKRGSIIFIPTWLYLLIC